MRGTLLFPADFTMEKFQNSMMIQIHIIEWNDKDHYNHLLL